ncbi:hypothetical protein H0H92_006675 [Tricholoma furcatifolium]|nr:hypothetical protein H0H92_006675 [Tricholoma furcatifolium]
MVHDHLGLNYMYGLVLSASALDAAKLGNETRYLNDSKDEPNKNNCIGQAVKVKNGQELLLSYGDSYWNAGINDAHDGDGDGELNA